MAGNMNISAQQLMKRVSEALFYVIDLKLYLDTHPDDTKALRMFSEAAANAKACVEAFENRCYPLFAVNADCGDSWEWLVGAWPSQKMQ